jgi:hypothetical protein
MVRGTQAEPGQRHHRVAQLLAPPGQRVPAGTPVRVDPRDQARVLQRLEPLGEQVGTDARQRVQQLPVPARPDQQLPDDEQRPPLPHHVERQRQPALLLVTALLPDPGHIASAHPTATCY